MGEQEGSEGSSFVANGPLLYEGQLPGDGETSAANFETEVFSELDLVRAAVERTTKDQPRFDESGENPREQSPEAGVRVAEIKLTHPDYVDTEPASELDVAQREVISILYRWKHLEKTGEYVTAHGEPGMHIDENHPVTNGTVHETVRMTYPEFQEKRMEAVEDLKRLFEIPGVTGGGVVVTRPKDTVEPDREFSNVLGFTINPIGNIIIIHSDPDREGLIVEQRIDCIGAPDGCDIKFLQHA